MNWIRLSVRYVPFLEVSRTTAVRFQQRYVKSNRNFPNWIAAQQNVVRKQLRSQWAAGSARLAVGSSAAAVDWQGSSGGW